MKVESTHISLSLEDDREMISVYVGNETFIIARSRNGKGISVYSNNKDIHVQNNSNHCELTVDSEY